MTAERDAAVTVLSTDFAEMPQGADTLEDGSLVCVDVNNGDLITWSPGNGKLVVARTSSGPIGLVMGRDENAYLAHTGGHIGDFWTAPDAIDPCIQILHLGTTLPHTVLTEVEGRPLIAPHDICWGADGRLWFTDSNIWRWDEEERTEPGAIIAIDPDGTASVVVETGPDFPCGIVGDADGAVYWGESYRDRIMRRDPDGSVSLYYQLPEGHVPHALRFSADGSLWVASFGSSTVDVVAPDGSSIREIPLGDGIHPMSLSFEGTTLYVTAFREIEGDEMVGDLFAIDAGIAGAPVIRGSLIQSTLGQEQAV
ncbi:SMP-30/gluconolactonase/LRE family protein [Leifsonia shinshuensis]|nr:SMP-30/gluconolactonase/LRE family protein [Leifsonia shinshuensis]